MQDEIKLTDEHKKVKEEIIKLATDIKAEVAKVKETGEAQQKEFEVKLHKMVEDMVKKGFEDQRLHEQARLNGKYDSDEALAKKFGLDPYPNKMHMPIKRAEMYYGDKFAKNLAHAQELADQLLIVKTALAHKVWKQSGGNEVLNVRELKSFKELHGFIQSDRELEKALYSTGSGLGDEWVPTGFSAQLVEAVALETKVAGLFEQINMPTNPYTLPVDSRGTGAYLLAENSSGSSPTKMTETATSGVTTNATFTAKKLGARVVLSEELNEDSIINVLDFIKRRMVTDLAEGLEDAIINGDDNGTHMDSDITGTTSVKEAFDGLRYYALNNGTNQIAGGNAAPDIDDIRNMRKELGKYGVNPKKLALITGLKVYQDLLAIDQVETLEKFGGQFTALSGVLGVIDGMPIVVSEFARETLNASGVYDNSTTDRACLIMPHRPSFMIGNRSGIQVNSLMDIEYDQIVLVAKMRKAFQNVYGASEDNVAIGINFDA